MPRSRDPRGSTSSEQAGMVGTIIHHQPNGRLRQCRTVYLKVYLKAYLKVYA